MRICAASVRASARERGVVATTTLRALYTVKSVKAAHERLCRGWLAASITRRTHGANSRPRGA
jgi:hypothetical protein